MDYDFCAHEDKPNWRVSPKRQRGEAAKDLLKPLTAQIEPLNHRTIEPLNQKSQIAQEYGLLPTDARQQLVLGKQFNGIEFLFKLFCRLFTFLSITPFLIFKLTNRPQFSIVYTLIDHTNDVIKCSKLNSSGTTSRR